MNLLFPHGFEVNYTVGFARGLVGNGVALTVVSDDAMAPALAAAGIRHENLRGSVEPRRARWDKLANLTRYYLLLLWTIFRRRGRVMHFTGVLTSRLIIVDGLILPVWFWLWAGRYIYTAHNALPHSREASALFRCIYRWIYRFPDTIIAHTAKVAAQLESEFRVNPSRIRTVSIGLNEEIEDAGMESDEARKQLQIPPSVPVALFFGKIEPYKGVDLLIEAWGLVRKTDARLMIVGSCSDSEYGRAVHQLIEQSQNAATIEWRESFVPNDTVAAWFRACDVVVMPYRHIYQSGVIFLCLRFGVPMVATDVGSLAEYIGEECGLITKSNDPHGIASALDHFFSDPARFRRDNIVRLGLKYRWDRQCAAIAYLYDQSSGIATP